MQTTLYRDWYRDLGWQHPGGDAPAPTFGPEQAVEAIRTYAAENHITRFLSFGAPPGLPEAWADEHLRLMAETVMPAFR